ncbi:DNA-binding response regulator [Streptacidiphilus pinicola]|uniref:DNA-binding response regulator n=1 Tax=Streptacidiphilus pinicola TaxID=2219663 RepID=A0A2X0IF40_9ACTN|nr:response regulator transcription factor [Streptacidiphilus pinicola]RAG83644.1 DNA-binding response regulator [Streptacidiphilus pinicola]
MTSVLVADDQVLIRAGLAALLRAAPGLDVVGEAEDGEAAVELAWATRPDIVLMDVRMPRLDGIAATRRLLAPDSPHRPKVLILTTFDLDEYVYKAIQAGASGFLLKDTGPDRLLAGISTVAHGDTLLAPNITRRLIEAFAPEQVRPEPQQSRDLELLTGRENQVLRLVAKGLDNQDIAQRLHVSQATVKTHLNRAMTKLGLSSRAQAVVHAYEHGLVVPSVG